MKYMLTMNTPRGGDYQIMSWPKKDIEAHIAFMISFNMAIEVREVPSGPPEDLD
jgi:hypothetical protein